MLKNVVIIRFQHAQSMIMQWSLFTETNIKQLPFWILNSGFYSIDCEAYLKVPMLFFCPSIHFIVDDMIKTLRLKYL